ncbi:hypothetical protein CCE01nite_11960 [Cellulomonas cellasea]|uniref:Pentapeptide repeat-containing protein n=2 Tax=Cellulomonas cellasea TaxID=43670 RepID=A0A4Y3KTM4_9CELL|nr:pentapeptide repeat-containing protein [Cellulomonas cellasea]GEA87247.1 hypothetical protein CCE01nite_11960 [Cellulomonas cellasea]
MRARRGPRAPWPQLPVWVVPALVVTALAWASARWGYSAAAVGLGLVLAAAAGWVVGAGVDATPEDGSTTAPVSQPARQGSTAVQGVEPPRGAILRGADLTGADLTGADLRGADLRDVDLTGAVLRDADLRGARLSDVSGTPGRRRARLRGTQVPATPRVARRR